jgi:hypothetical protein
LEQKRKISFRKWWGQVRPKKAVVFWSWVASVALTMIIGFAWGGWVTSAKAQRMAEDMAEDAVTERLAEICVFQFNQDPGKGAKLAEMREASGSQRRKYVEDQGWSTIPGEELGRKVVDECVRQLILIEP